MALSKNVIDQFAKLTNVKTKDEGSTVKGTYKKIDGVDYVQLDGSDILTPVNMSVDAETNERVSVLIKDHMATLVENITSPAARSKSVQDLADTVDEQGNTIQQMDNTIVQQGNSIIQMNNAINQQGNTINQHDNKINQQGDEIVSINNTLLLQGNAIEATNNTVEAHGTQISTMNDTINSQGNNIDIMNNTLSAYGNRITANENNITAQGNTITAQGNTINQQGNRIEQIDNTIREQGNTIVAQGNTIDAHENVITAHDSNITILNSGFVIEDGRLTGLSSAVLEDLETNTLSTGYAKIDFANIEMAAVEKLFSESGIIKELVVEEGAITGELVGVTIKGDLIEGNTIVADKLVIKGSDGLYYKLNTDGETVESEQTNQNSLNGEVITAKSITATKISVDDLVAFGATIGGFDISDRSINTHLKTTVQSPDSGLYLGSDGQMAIGNDINYIKYYKNEDDDYILDVRLDKLYLGASEKTAEQQFTGMVELSATNLTTVFKTSGGSNLLRNSVGYSGTDFWFSTGNITTNQNDDMSLSGSEFILTDDAELEQVYSTIPGNPYSIAFKYKHTVVGPPSVCSVKIVGEDGDVKTILSSSTEENTWVTVSMDEPYIATINNPSILISCPGNDIFEITDLVISQGTNDIWSGYIDEVYGKQHQLDKQGLRLYSETSNRSTNTTSTSYQLKEGSTVVGELTKDRVYSDLGEFNLGMRVGRLRTVILDDNNIIEYIE